MSLDSQDLAMIEAMFRRLMGLKDANLFNDNLFSTLTTV